LREADSVMPYLQNSSETETIVGIQFGVFSPEEVTRRSVVEITTHDTRDGTIGGLFDPRMGVLENGKLCRSCGLNNHNCPGHFGHFKLARPVYYIQFFKLVMKVLRCVCIKCGKLRIDKNRYKHLLRLKGEARWKQVLEHCSVIRRCGEDIEDGCGARQPSKFRDDDLCRLVAEWKDIELPEGMVLPAELGTGIKDGVIERHLEPEYVYRILRRISDEDVDFMGFSRFWCRPDWMMCTVLPIAPPQVRPSVLQDNNQRSEDDLTQKLIDIIKTNKNLEQKIKTNAKKKAIDEWTMVLQYHIATLIDNEIPGVAPSAQRSGRPLKSLQQRLGSKEGRIRNNLQGKRVEFSARSVITPDPNISVAELGVPLKIAMNLTHPERVTAYNINRLYALIQNGPDKYPGAKSIIRTADGRIISLKHVQAKDIQLFKGDIVNRHIMDGDPVLFNRQPSLHRMSMMGHRAKVLPYNTFRLNVSVTAPYNADFDGDEMNAHIPQSIEAAIELCEIAAVPLQIVGPRESKPIVSVVQDTLVGVNRFTRPNVMFNRRESMNLLIWASRWSGVLPEPAIKEPVPLWSGQQLLSTLLPPVNLEMRNLSYDDSKDTTDSPNFVKIKNGIIIQGILDKDVFSKALIHVIYNDYGHEVTVNFLDSLQRMMANFLMNSGFSVGISDLIADEDTKGKIDKELSLLKGQIEDIVLQVHTGLFDNSSGRTNQDEFESKVFATLNKVIDKAGKEGRNSLSDDNRMTNMIKAGSKGSNTNVAQMIAVLGQQNIEGKRIPYGFQDRTLPHFKRFDDGAAARGFIESSFVKGLTPHEFFFHAMSGREGLIDTAVKSVTADTPIIIIENNVTKRVKIGDWVDAMLELRKSEVEYFPEEADLEMLQVDSNTYIPSVSPNGTVSWGKISAVTRHDPGNQLYRIETLGGRSVIVTASKSLLIYNSETSLFEQRNTPDVRPGDAMPVTMSLSSSPSITTSIKLSNYLPKSAYLYGTDFSLAQVAVKEAMVDRERVPAGWWEQNNGKLFTLPYENKGRFVRTLTRSKTDNISSGYIYPFTTNRDGARIPDEFVLNTENGIFIGLFLAEGNVDVKSGYVAITNNSPEICQFVHDWFENNRMTTIEETHTNAIGGKSTTVRGFSTVLAKFMDMICGHGSANKRVPAEAFTSPNDFIVGLLNGYFSGDGTVTSNSIESGSASQELTEGITMLLSRLGVFAKMFKTQNKTNNIGTENILPSYRLSVRAQWATILARTITFIDPAKEAKRVYMKATKLHPNFPSQNDVVMDEIVKIELVSPDAYPKMYDLTVPDTFTFGLANGLQVYDTADTGYMQRQLVKAMEDLTIQHDGSVRDAVGNIVQFAYGEDGINCTKIESQPLNLGAMSNEEIAAQFAVKDVSAERNAAYIKSITEDRYLLVERVYQRKLEKADKQNVYYPVHLDRLVHTVARQSEFPAKGAVATGDYILDAQQRIMEKTLTNNRLWQALVRYHLAPHKIQKLRYTPAAIDLLSEQIILKHWKAMANPGEMVGIIAAQSIGEPSTQMTLNSVDWDTKIMIAKNGHIVCPQIGEFIDNYLETCDPTMVQHLPNDQIYIDLKDGNDWQAISCDQRGNVVWTKLEAITRHPVINEDGTDTILEVTLQSGRKVKATKGKSFLSLQDGLIKELNGSDLKIGTQVPIAASLGSPNIINTFNVRTILPPTEWIYGTDVLTAKTYALSDDRHWFQKHQGQAFTVPYARSDAFRDAFIDNKNSNSGSIQQGHVYPKRTRPDVSQIPESIPLDANFGFFVGAYLAEGMSNETQINITNNDQTYLSKVVDQLNTWNVGHHTVKSERHCQKTDIKGTSTSLVIHSTVLATVFQKTFGRVSHEKTIPDWVYQAPTEFVQGLFDGYISGDGTVEKRSGTIHATSVSKDLLVRLQTLLARFNIFTTMASRTPDIGKFDSVKTNYTMTMPPKYSQLFAHQFKLTCLAKQTMLDKHFMANTNSRRCYRETLNDIVWDKVTDIKEVKPMYGWVYDVTVEQTKNFMTMDAICMRDTFHLAGVAAKSNVTRGVPRLKELLKATKNPKAVSLTIYLRKDIRSSKVEARRVSQELEFTVLQDLVTVARIYFDPRDDATLINDDAEWLSFYAGYEAALRQVEGPEDAAAGGGAAPVDVTADATAVPAPAAAGAEEVKKSPWILRLELNREKMFSKNITMDDIAFVLNQKFDTEVSTVYSDYNATRLVFRLRLRSEEPDPLNSLNVLKILQNKILLGTIVRGVPGLKSVSFNKTTDQYELADGKYQAIEQFVLDTDGSNMLDVMCHPDVDPTRCYSNNVHDIFENFGIEATRAILFKEVSTLFEETYVNYRHLCLLCEVMASRGRLMSIDRYGINKNNIGPLAKASFEQTEDIMLRAALYGELDPVTGVSANIMTGQTIRGGTSFSQLLLDEEALLKYMNEAPEDKRFNPESETQVGEDALDGALFKSETGYCSASNLHLDAPLPRINEDVEAEDMPEANVVELVDE